MPRFRNGSSATTSILTVGNNDQMATFGGALRDSADGAGGIVALTKIGGGVQTLTGANTYSGNTVVDGGTLMVGGAGSIAGSQQILRNVSSGCNGNRAGQETAGSVDVSEGGAPRRPD